MTRDDVLEKVLAAGSDSIGVFGGRYEGGIRLQQEPEEYAEFLWSLIQEPLSFSHICEVGTAAGGNARMLAELLLPSRLLLIDDNSHRSGALARIETLDGVRRTEIIGDSRSQAVLEMAFRVMPYCELLFIDGCHDYPYVSLDYQNYSRMVVAGGLMAFHDTNHEPGVMRVQEEIRESLDLTGGWELAGDFQRLHGITVWRRL